MVKLYTNKQKKHMQGHSIADINVISNNVTECESNQTY